MVAAHHSRQVRHNTARAGEAQQSTSHMSKHSTSVTGDRVKEREPSDQDTKPSEAEEKMEAAEETSEVDSASAGESEDIDAKVCDECEGALVEEPGTGDLACEDCGLIVEQSNIDRGPEWRAFNPSERSERSRVGPARTELRHDRGLTTNIDWKNKDAYGKSLSARQRSKMTRLRKWNERSKRSGSDRRLSYANGEIMRMGSALGVPKSIQETAASLYRQSHDNGLVPGRSIEGVASACLYISLRVHEKPRSLDEIANVSRVERKPIMRTQRYICRELEIPLKPTSPSKYIPRFADGMDVSQQVIRTAEKLVEVVPGEETSGRDPTVLAASVLYAASLLEGERVTQREASDAGDVTTVSVRNNYRIFMEYSDEVETSENRIDDARKVTHPTPRAGQNNQRSGRQKRDGRKPTVSSRRATPGKNDGTKTPDSVSTGSDTARDTASSSHSNSDANADANADADAGSGSAGMLRSDSNGDSMTEEATADGGDTATNDSDDDSDSETVNTVTPSEDNDDNGVTVEHDAAVSSDESPGDVPTSNGETTDQGTGTDTGTDTGEHESEDEDDGDSDGEYECEECSFSTDTERGLNIHRGRIHGTDSESSSSSGSNGETDGEYECEECSFSSDSKRGLNIHRARTHDLAPIGSDSNGSASDGEYECDECEYASETKRGLKIHVGMAHDGSSSSNDGTVEDDYDYDYECDFCGFGSDSYKGLRIHQGREHDGDRNADDDGPPSLAVTTSQEKREYPDDEYNFECLECDRVFGSYQGVSTHTGHQHDGELQGREVHSVDPDEKPVTPAPTPGGSASAVSDDGVVGTVEPEFKARVESFFDDVDGDVVHPAVARLAESMLLTGGRNAGIDSYRSSDTAIGAALYAAVVVLKPAMGTSLTQQDVAEIADVAAPSIARHYSAYVEFFTEHTDLAE